MISYITIICGCGCILLGYVLGTVHVAIKLSKSSVKFYVVMEYNNEGRDEPICVTFLESMAKDIVVKRNIVYATMPEQHYYYKTVLSKVNTCS